MPALVLLGVAALDTTVLATGAPGVIGLDVEPTGASAR